MQFPVVRKLSPILTLPITLVLAAGILGFVLWRAGDGPSRGKIGFQDADFPLSMPRDGEIDHRFQWVSAWDHARIPVAERMDPPMGGEHGALVYNAQKFREMNEARGGPHLGDDLNGIGGMNTDLGDPVFAIADGLVLYTGEPSPGWGKTVIMAHKAADGRMLHSMFAHLHRIDVPRGSMVARGGKIGTVGTSNGYYPAHLHFEIRTANEVDIGPGYGDNPLNRVDPMATVASMRKVAPDALSPSPLQGVLAAMPGWTTLEIQGAEKSPLMLKDPGR